MAAKCGRKRYCKPKVKTDLACHSCRKAMGMPYIYVFVSCPRLMGVTAVKCRGHLVTRWPWHLTCYLEKVLLLEIFFSHVKPMNMITIFALFPEILAWLRTCSRSHPLSPKHEYREQCTKSHCDVNDDAIVVKMVSFYIICHLAFITDLKL